MNAIPLSIKGAWIIESQIFRDDRGSFSEWFKKSSLEALTGERFDPLQANVSISRAGVIRGIHYSVAPRGQAKLVTVLSGSILDVAVDIRVGSPTFGMYETVEVKAGEGKSILLSHDLAHGFQALEDDTVVSYLVSAEYDPHNENEISPRCTSLNIQWSPLLEPVLSEKDAKAPNVLTRQADNSLPRFSNS